MFSYFFSRQNFTQLPRISIRDQMFDSVLRVSEYGKVRWRCDILVLVHNVWVFFLNWNAIFLTTPMFLCSAKNVTNWVDFSRSTATLQLVCPPGSSSLSPPEEVNVRHLESEISLLLIKWNQFLPLICSQVVTSSSLSCSKFVQPLLLRLSFS